MATGVPNTSVPASVYNGGAVVFNPMPFVNFYQQKKAREQAREDAFYKYFGEMSKGLTTTGMSANDIPGLMQRKNQWQQYALQNKDAINRPSLDGGKAYGEYLGRFNDMQNYIGHSVDKSKNLLSLNPILRSPQKNALLNAATMNDIHSGSLPIDHQDYKRFDPAGIQFNPPPFDIKQQNSLRSSISAIKPANDSPTIQNIGNHQQQITHNYKFGKDELTGLYNIGATQYDNNPSFRTMIDGIEHSDQYDQLNQVYKQHYGHDIQNEHDLSAAYVFSLHPTTANKVETRNIPYSPWDRSAASLANQKEMFDYRQQHKEDASGQQDTNAENFLSGQEKEGRKLGNFPYFHADTNTKEEAYKVPFTPDQIRKIFGQRDISGKHLLVPDDVRQLKSGDYLPIYYKRDENGNRIQSADGTTAIDQDYTKPISRDAVKASILANKIVSKKPTTSESSTSIKIRQPFGQGGLN